ncbi:hypothetical protein JTB14_017638 [Gonioctena quinquepunctata]|nr:hypothetical protein JTB14_017638 [Gonioctena quinquepunctata]
MKYLDVTVIAAEYYFAKLALKYLQLMMASKTLLFFCPDCLNLVREMPLIKKDMFEMRYEIKKRNENFRNNNNTSYAGVLKTINQEAEDLKKDVMDLKVKVDIQTVLPNWLLN